jgi:hypothetical protein
MLMPVPSANPRSTIRSGRRPLHTLPVEAHFISHAVNSLTAVAGYRELTKAIAPAGRSESSYREIAPTSGGNVTWIAVP